MKETQVEFSPNSRRDFFTKMLLASFAAALPPMAVGCGKEMEFRGSGKSPYKVWEEILHVLGTSPDHLTGRMKALIVEGDPEAMFLFVRDEIQLIPVYDYKIGSGASYKWGLDYALRSGMATLREKADLLQLMYAEAGISAKVMNERVNISTDVAPGFFFRPFNHQFAPTISKRTFKRWAKELGVEDFTPTNLVTEKRGEAQQLAQKIWEHLGIEENHSYKSFDFRWPNYDTPTVSFEWQGETKYAHLADPSVLFGQLRNDDNRVSEASAIKENKEKVEVALTYRDSIASTKEKELILGEWRASDLVGRQLDIRFLNNLTLEEQSIVPVGNMRIFTPSMGLQAIDKDISFMAERSVLADPITLSAKRVKSESGILKIDEMSLLGKAHPQLQKEVVSLSSTVSTFGIRNVKLSVSPRDGQANMIEGLEAPDFNITENGKPIKALLQHNQRTPKILIMADQSGSMPYEYRGKYMQAFADKLKKNILEKYPAAIIDYWHTPSSLFTWLLKASQTENDLVVFATDGHNDDEYNPQNESLYRNGPPAIVLNVTNRTSDLYVNTFKKMAELTGGIHLPITAQEEAMHGILKFLEGIEVPPYVFTYNSVEKTGVRKVKVSVNEDKTAETTTYEVAEAKSSTEVGPSIIGVYLTLKYSNQKKVSRVLAGWDYTVYPYKKPTQKMADEVNDLFFGGMQLYFEGNGPTLSAALSDLLKAKLSTRKWGEALLDNDLEKAKKAFQEGQFNISGNALSLMAPLGNATTESSMTIPGGLRIGIQKYSPGFITGTVRSQFDYLPTSAYHTLAINTKEGFKTTLEKTAQLALREAMIFQDNTLAQLLETTWIGLEEAKKQKWFSGRDTEGRYWYNKVYRGARFKVFDKTAEKRAFWQVAPGTGELYGILSNGSGGGEDVWESEVEQYNRIVQNLNNLIWVMDNIASRIGGGVGVNPIGGLALGVVARYGELLIKLYALASQAIMIMDASFINEGIRKALAQFACQVKAEIMGAITGMSPPKEMLESLISAIAPSGYKNPFGCD
ncbi:MAG: hypothetical protein AAF039_14550 [Bacteroidota bacterium]